jgi:hypothetical protein
MKLAGEAKEQGEQSGQEKLKSRVNKMGKRN